MVDIRFSTTMNKNSKILVLGSRGLVGSAIVRELKLQGYFNLLTPVRDELDLMRQEPVEEFFKTNKPEYIFMAAAKVGGILANNTYRADFIFQNLQIQQNVFNAAFKYNVLNLLFLGSSCIYPKNAPQPIKEEYLLTSLLEQTNEPYAIAKIAGLKTAEAFRKQYNLNWISAMPTNLYGENDNFDTTNSHVIPGLIRRMYEAKLNNNKTFEIWGTGRPRREFLYVDDMAKACVFLMQHQGEKPDFINIGTGTDIEIGEVAKIISQKLGFGCKLIFDHSKPDGTLRKLLDITKISNMGWKPVVNLEDGLDKTISSFLEKMKLEFDR